MNQPNDTNVILNLSNEDPITPLQFGIILILMTPKCNAKTQKKSC